MKKPEWLKIRVSNTKNDLELKPLFKSYGINTVCEEAACPNIRDCWSKKHAAFIIMGQVCTRACKFCNIATGKPDTLDQNEPRNLALTIREMKLKHAVITSVDRDDLEDGGADHFIKCIKEIREISPNTTIELLTPDFKKDVNLGLRVAREKPDVFNHNIETVPRLYGTIRPGARYFSSLNLLYSVKASNPEIFTKSGFMLGLGETDTEISQILDDLRAAKVDFVTIGQYLQPTPRHADVDRYVTPKEFDYYKRLAKVKGFLMVSSSPFTRSSYHADSDFLKLKLARVASLRKEN